MHDQIAHRGPDGEGFAIWDAAMQGIVTRSRDELTRSAPARPRIGMAFRWLKIQDPHESAAQPMPSPDGAACLLFNGEIYNFQEIRAELQNLGHQFVSVGDTEVILAAYAQWGIDCFKRLNGMWAIILVDLKLRKIIMSRDRFGIKPLFYYFGGNRLIIASEIKQIIAAGAPADANRSALARFIRGVRPERPEESFFDNIFAQPAATYAEIDLASAPSGLSFSTYWQFEPCLREPAPSLADAASELEQLLRQSVSEHMVGRAPVGHLISGGLDSSVLAALAAPIYARRGERGVGASMVLEKDTDPHDESVHIDELSKALDFRSCKATLSAAWLKANIARATWTQEEPLAGIAVAAQYLAYETAARQGLRIVLDGQGSDELFGGYPRHQTLALTDWLRRGAYADVLGELASLARRDPGFFRDVWRLRLAPRLARLLGVEKKDRQPDFVLTTPATAPATPPSQPAKTTALTRSLMTDVFTYNLKSALAFTDRNAMAHSIEARVPYIDRRIAEFAFALPDKYKIGGGERKHILRLVARKFLPRAIVDRVDRIGFGAPIHRWVSVDFRDELAVLADSPTFAKSGILAPVLLRNYINAFLAGRHRDAATLWRLYAVDLWARTYSVNPF
ncbi:asparagine synthase (glutamine-hydrolyzing) [Bradyrhizobium sp.]|uniref:asparagine synthase (glutamine-hydrolyzing) n=1 Tax=Bradyrhizobium sp. TaxID=376 RepID=UPI003C753248